MIYADSPDADIDSCCMVTPAASEFDLLSFPSNDNPNEATRLAAQDLIILTSGSFNRIEDSILQALEDLKGLFTSVTTYSAAEVSEIPRNSTVVVLWEVKSPRLRTLSLSEFEYLQSIAERAGRVLWVAGNSALSPDATLVQGLLSTLSAEQPSTEFRILKVDDTEEFAPVTARNIKNLLCLFVGGRLQEKEYRQGNGAIYISRFTPADSLNNRLLDCLTTHTTRMCQRDCGKYSLTVEDAGQLDTLKFIANLPIATPLPGQLQIRVEHISLNAKVGLTRHISRTTGLTVQGSLCAQRQSGRRDHCNSP